MEKARVANSRAGVFLANETIDVQGIRLDRKAPATGVC